MTPCPKPPKREKVPRKPMKRKAPMAQKPPRKAGPVRRKKGPSIKSLREKADAMFSVLVRARDGRCIITGSTENLQCSHLYGKKARPATRYDFQNAHAMTAGAHYAHHNNDEGVYWDWARAHYSPAAMDALMVRSRASCKRDRTYYEGVIAWLKSLTPEDVLALTWPKE